MTRTVALLLASLSLLASACQDDLEAASELPALDRPYFDCHVQPVLAKYCGQLACHGADDRYFRVYSRNRLRLVSDENQRNAFLAAEERVHNYDAARAFVDRDDPSHSLLLRKPLEAAAGGYFHVGATLYGGANVFATAEDPDYDVLVSWIAGTTEEPTCQEPGSNL